MQEECDDLLDGQTVRICVCTRFLGTSDRQNVDIYTNLRESTTHLVHRANLVFTKEDSDGLLDRQTEHTKPMSMS